MPKLQDLTGRRFGRLVVIDKAPSLKFRTMWHVLCDCGNTRAVRGDDMKRGLTKSCGCLRKELASIWCASGIPATSHGVSRHPSYFRWVNMMNRCYQETNSAYRNYGLLGVTVCPSWHDMTVFFQYLDNVLGPPPEKFSLDRINVFGNYEPGNVRWASARTQALNRRKKGQNRVS